MAQTNYKFLINTNMSNEASTSCQTAISGSVYSMDLMLKEIEDKLESYKQGNEYLEDYQINSTLTDFQRGYRYCLKNMRKYIKEKGMWYERILRVEADR